MDGPMSWNAKQFSPLFHGCWYVLLIRTKRN